jgi:predicted Zn-dependent peptidase
MKKSIMALSATFLYLELQFLHKSFEEYNLDNGLHVILQNDPSAPVVITSVMYHVGAKMKIQKELVAHFRTFLFEGENIKRGEWFKIVTGNGGTNNTEDRTYTRSIPI